MIQIDHALCNYLPSCKTDLPLISSYRMAFYYPALDLYQVFVKDVEP